METVDRSPPSAESVQQGHESTEARFHWLGPFLVALLVLGIVVELVLRTIMGHFMTVEKRTGVPPPRFADTSGLFPGPRLQSQPRDDLVELKREMSRKLGVDARIPLERAMREVAERGLPDRTDAAKRAKDGG